MSVNLSEADYPHALVVACSPEATNAETLLAEIRKCDKDAAMVSL